jgi:hypothetical protein
LNRPDGKGETADSCDYVSRRKSPRTQGKDEGHRLSFLIYLAQNSGSALNEEMQFDRVVRIQLERDQDGRVHLRKGRKE